MALASNPPAASGLTTRQLRLLGALLAGGIPAAFATVAAIIGVGLWPFALLGVVPGIILGAIFGPLAARTQTPTAAAFFVGFVGYFAGIAFDLVGAFALSALFGTQSLAGRDPSFIQQLAPLLFWGAIAQFLGGIPGSLAVSFLTVRALRVANGAKPMKVFRVATASALLLAAAGAVASARVITEETAEQARADALFEGPVRLGLAHANISSSSYELVVRYPDTGFETVAETYGSCESGSGGFRLQPGWTLTLRRTDAPGQAVAIADATTYGGEAPEVAIFIDQDGDISVSRSADFPGEADPRWQECVQARQ